MSIYNKIRVIFLVASLFTTAFFVSFFYIKKSDHLLEIQKRYIQTSLYIHRNYRQDGYRAKNRNRKKALRDNNLKFFLEESDFGFVQNKKKAAKIIKKGHIVHKRKFRNSIVKIIGNSGQLYLSIQNPRYSVLLKDKQPMKFPLEILLTYSMAMLFLFGLYIWLTRSLSPLKELQSQIQKVANGDLSISVKSAGSDEIAEVANAFDDALRKLESLINSRQLFLRSIMHELKTPIAKGKLLNEFLHENEYKMGYEAVFERLELLIEEFSKIERMLSSSYTAKLAHYNARDIIEQALELMIMDEDEINNKIEISQSAPFSIYTDFELLSLAIKNLIDNAIKYSPDHSAKIIISVDHIDITNRGGRFTDSLEPYTKPFHAQGHGLGLGLYIVQNIVDMLKLKIEYHYIDSKNIFRITN